MSDTATPPPTSPTPITEEGAAEPGPPRGSGWRPPRHGVTVTVVIVALAVIGVLAVLAAWRLPPFSGGAERTDNAYVRGQTTVISPQVSGYVTEVRVQDYQQVAAGQPLVAIDPRIYRQRVDQAQANLDTQIANLDNSVQTRKSREAQLQAQEAAVGNANAQLLRAQADMRRVDDLASDGSVSLRERDQTRAALRQAEAAVKQAEAAREVSRQDVRAAEVSREGLEAAVEAARAALRLAQIDLANTVITAPEAGQLSDIGVRRGQYVTSGTQLMFLVPPTLWVIANYKEAQTAGMQPGQAATFTVDALAGAQLRGHVERLSPAAGSEFSVLRPDNATGNFTKVPQRISVRISVDPGQRLAARLRPGMSVEARVDISSGPRP